MIDANLPQEGKTWQAALDYIQINVNGDGLGGYNDWRLPNRYELESLLDMSRSSPALPSGHPFTFESVGSYYYWSSTTDAAATDDAWYVNLLYGAVASANKITNSYYVWPVRGGQ